ncbi:MAG TPA: hypothetical protein PKC45_09785 [Gemmatales bacterium]|nr:hypothetical protein [Gemmatales bacterium]
MTASVTNRYMPAEDVIVYVTERLRTSASRLMLPVPDDRGRSTADGERPAVDVGEARSRKKRLGQSLVDFWTGTDCPPDSLNKYILLTARMLRFEVSEAEAVGVLQNYMAEHPDLSFSDRLSSGQHAEVSRVIRSTAGRPTLRRAREYLTRPMPSSGASGSSLATGRHGTA